jgi:hypothetical protein
MDIPNQYNKRVTTVEETFTAMENMRRAIAVLTINGATQIRKPAP